LAGSRIKTQDAIFGEFATERLVEIGPAETLTNMASKTVDADYTFQDIALGVQRELLSYNRDGHAIYYDTPDSQAPVPVTTSAASVVPDVANTTDAGLAPMTPPKVDSTTRAAVIVPAPAVVSIPDKAITPHDIITTIVALGLKKEPSTFAQDQTIKALCGGKLIMIGVACRAPPE
jgi:hypothetical protein